MKPNKEDFDKAVKKKISGCFGATLACGISVALCAILSNAFYTLEPISIEIALVFGMFLLFAWGFLVWNLIELMEFSFSKKISKKYHLCNRCNSLIKKDKVFCNNCYQELKRSIKYLEDKSYFKDYKKVIKKEKNK